MKKNRKKLSRISVMHFWKLGYRSALFLAAIGLYIYDRVTAGSDQFEHAVHNPWILGVIFGVFAVEMIFRFFPSKMESMGCQKQFKRNFEPTGETIPALPSWQRTFISATVWFLLNGIFFALYFLHIFDKGIMLLIALAYSVCDMICILFFCPFQTWFLKNKCCTSCRIYNWDYAMMFTPLLVVPHFVTWSLLAIALLLLIRWEVTFRLYPERFSETTNACLACKNCNERLCQHKKQLRGFLKKNKDRFTLLGNRAMETVRAKTKKK